MIEQVKIELVASFLFWVLCCAVFFLNVKAKQKHIWKALIGEDGKLDMKEVTQLYWVWLYPITAFTVLLMAVVGLTLEPYHVELIQWLLGSLSLVSGFILFNK